MKRAAFLMVLLASGVLFATAPASAQSNESSPSSTPQVPITQPKAPGGGAAPFQDFFTGNLFIGGQAVNDVGSSKFQEYRDYSNGGTLPLVRLFGSKNDVRFDFRAENVRLNDERYTGFVSAGLLTFSGDYNAIIHNIGNSGRSMLFQQSPGVWRMSPALQQAFQNSWESTPTAARIFPTYVSPLFGPSIADGAIVDVSVQRERSNVAVDIAKNMPFAAKVNYTREQRHGSGGMSGNNLSYVTETPTVTEYLTQDFGANAALDKPWGSVRAGLHYNWFTDQVPALIFDSPFRATDAASRTVGTGAAATAVGGPASGLVVNPPDNAATTGAFGTTVKLPAHTRITADVNLARLTQNAQLFPFVTNTAVVTSAGALAASTASLPVQSLNGQIDTTSLVFALTSRPVDPVQVNLRYRRYDLNNQTPRVAFADGIGNFDRTWSSQGRVTAPYGYTNDRFDATAGYTVGVVTFEGGYRRTTMDRTFRETEQTAENAGSIAAVMHISDVANLKAIYEKASRDYSGLEIERSEDATVLVPGTGLASNLLARPGNLRFDQAQRDSNRAGLDFDVSAGAATVTVSYLRHYDTYKNAAHGLQNDHYDTVTGEVSLAPTEQWDFFAYYTYEKNGNDQLNNGLSQFPAIGDYTTLLIDRTNSVGAGITFAVVPGKAIVNLSGRYQKVDGAIDFTTQPGSTYDLARVSLGGVKNIPNADDTKLTRLDASLDYTLSRALMLTVGGFHEDYRYSDYLTAGLQNLYPSTFFLAVNNGSYNATLGYVRLSYRW